MFEHDIKDASKKNNIFRNNFFLLFVNRLYHENEAASYFSFLNIYYRKFQLTWKKKRDECLTPIQRFDVFITFEVCQLNSTRMNVETKILYIVEFSFESKK